MTPERDTLWLPPGSIRAIVTILLAVVACYLAVIGKDAPDWFISFASLALGSYFNKGEAQGIRTGVREAFASITGDKKLLGLFLATSALLLTACATNPDGSKRYTGPSVGLGFGLGGITLSIAAAGANPATDGARLAIPGPVQVAVVEKEEVE